MSDQIQVTPEWEMSHSDRIAWRKAGRIPGWEVYAWQVVDYRSEHRDLIMEGGVPRLLKAGKNKGGKTWRDSKTMRVVVSEAEIEAEKLAYIEQTGNCPRCMGNGEVFASWLTGEDVKMKPCKDCDATGKHRAGEAA